MKTVLSYETDSSIYAHSNTLSMTSPFRWLKKGWHDFKSAPVHSVTYGAIFAAIGWLLVNLAQTNNSYFLSTLFFVMLFVGPALAFGLYDISQQLERNHEPSFSHESKKAFSEMGHELMLSLMMTVMFMFLVIFASMVTNILAQTWQTGVSAAIPLSDTTFMYITIVFACLLFCVNSFALPMILDKDANAGTATSTSLNAVWENKMVMLLWALMIVALTVVGFLTFLVGFLVIVPILGYASWHAYRETIVIE